MMLARLFLAAAAAALTALAQSGLVYGQSYPARPVQVVVPSAAGGQSDVTARIISQWLTERIGQTVVIENRPGAAGNIGSELVAKAKPDGYTLLLCGISNSISAAPGQQPNYDFLGDFMPVSGVSRAPYIMVVHPSVPPKTVQEFITWAKAQPGKVNLGSSGDRTASHLFGKMFGSMSRIDMAHLPSRSVESMLNDLISGRVQVAFGSFQELLPHIKDGRLRALGVTTGIRSALSPDLPTIDQSLRGYDAGTWTGLVAPKGTPAAVVERLNREINAGLVDAGVRGRLSALGASPLKGSPANFGRFIAADVKKWVGVIDGNFASECPDCQSGCRCPNTCDCDQTCCPD